MDVTADVISVFGFAHVGIGQQVMSEFQPALSTEVSLLKTNVKQPSGLVEVTVPGLIVPQKPPASPPGTLLGGFPELISVNGFIELPS